MKKGKNKNCELCGKEFYVLPCREKIAKYCSTICYSKSLIGKTNLKWKGKKHTEEWKQHMSKIMSGKKMPPRSEEYKEKQRSSRLKLLQSGWIPKHKGRPLSKEHREKLRLAHLGKNVGQKNPAWGGGITSENEKIRKSNPYVELMKEIKSLDDFTCQICMNRGGNLETNHIKLFSKYPELRLNRDNLITLCRKCHRKIRGKENQYEQFFKNQIQKNRWKFLCSFQADEFGRIINVNEKEYQNV